MRTKLEELKKRADLQRKQLVALKVAYWRKQDNSRHQSLNQALGVNQQITHNLGGTLPDGGSKEVISLAQFLLDSIDSWLKSLNAPDDNLGSSPLELG